MCFCNFLKKLLVCPTTKLARFIYQIIYSQRVFVKKVQNELIISILDSFQIIRQAFLYELFLFRFKHIGNIELLKLFICKVNAKLFEGI